MILFRKGNDYLSSGRKYFDLYVDDRFRIMFMGSKKERRPSCDGRATVVDPIPGLTWGANETVERNKTVYDQNDTT